MHEGAAAPSSSIRRRGRVPRRGAIFCKLGRIEMDGFSFPSVLKPFADGKSLPIQKKMSIHLFRACRLCRQAKRPGHMDVRGVVRYAVYRSSLK